MSPNKDALDWLSGLTSQNFWGTVSLKFENGRIVHVRQEVNMKPSELSGIPRRGYEATARY